MRSLLAVLPLRLLASLLLAASAGSAAAAVTQLGTELSQYATANTLASFTASAGTDRVLIVTVADPAATTVGAVPFGGTAMTQIITTTDGYAVDAIYYLRLGTRPLPAGTRDANANLTSGTGEFRLPVLD